MAKAPMIQTENLLLISHSEKFVSKEYVSWLNDPKVTRFSDSRHRSHTIKSCLEYVRSFDKTTNFLWAIVVNKDKKHIGNICAYVDTFNKTAEVRILVGDSSYQGQGLGGEAWNAVCDYLLIKNSMRKVFAGTVVLNKAMMGIAKKSGMKEEGRFKKHVVIDGKAVDLVFWSRYKS